MRIAVNARFLLKGELEGVGYFLYENFRRIVVAHPEHQFIFIFDRPFDNRFIFGDNVIPVVIGPAARHPLLWKLWYDVRVPAVLRKFKADVFVSGDGFCSLRTRVPQCVVIHDLSFLHYPKFIPRSHYIFYKFYTPKFVAKAKSLVTVSEFSKTDIARQYHIDAGKIAVVPNAAKDFFRPLSADEKEAVKEKYTAGKEYFVYAGSIHPRKNIINLLKAFSIFKKRQKSNWKLVLAGRLAWKYKQFIVSLETYKYRDDVVLTGYLEEEVANVLGAAYALVYPSVWEGFGVPIVEALKSEVAVITSQNSSMEEIGKNAAIYFDPADPADMADKMMLMYKNEMLRKELIENGRKVGEEYNWDRAAALLWNSILKAANL